MASCGGGGSSGGSSGPLKVIGAGSQEAGLRKALDEYKKANGSFEFNLSFSPADQLQTGSGPSSPRATPRICMPSTRATAARCRWSSSARRTSWPTSALRLDPEDPGRLQRRLPAGRQEYIFSPGTSVLGAIYNKPAFAKAGVEIPTTWSELLETCETLKKKGIIPFALGAQTPWVTS